MGRPSSFNQKTADEICERMAVGESLRKICRDNHMPAKSTVFKWCGDFNTFSDQYALARQAQADAYFDDAVDIADNATAAKAHVARLQVDVRKWAAGKLAPRKYGEKVALQHGNDPDNPLTAPEAVEMPDHRLQAIAAGEAAKSERGTDS